MSQPASPLHFRDFRLYWLARFCATSATIAMVVVIAAQTYQIARLDYAMDKSAAAFQLGLLGFFQFMPLLILTPVAGWVADRLDRRLVSAAANGLDLGIALCLAIASLNGLHSLPLIFFLAALHGSARVFISPAMSAMTPNLVPAALLPRAIAFSSVAWQIASVVGPATAGLLLARSATLAYSVSCALLLLAMLAVIAIRPWPRAAGAGHAHPLTMMREGGVFVLKQRFLLGCATLDLFAVLLGGATALLPVYAYDVLHVGSTGFGMLRAAPAIGAVTVSLWLAARPLQHNVGVKMLWAVAVFGGATVAFGLSHNFLFSLVTLVVLGGSDMISVFIRSTLIQLYTPDEMRGRVSSISGLAISASNELGEMQSGMAAALLGVTGAVVLGGAGAIAVTGLWAWLFPEIRRARTFAPPEQDPPLQDPLVQDRPFHEKEQAT
ncbi:MAG: MFS transporter [Novosphingobium sp.]